MDLLDDSRQQVLDMPFGKQLLLTYGWQSGLTIVCSMEADTAARMLASVQPDRGCVVQ